MKNKKNVVVNEVVYNFKKKSHKLIQLLDFNVEKMGVEPTTS